MNKTTVAITVLCIVLGVSLMYATAYTTCGEELIFTAEGEFERVLVKSTWKAKIYGRIYEDGGSFSYLTGLKPRNVIFQVVVYTSNNTYFGFIYTLIMGSAASEIGDVQITVESRREAVGTINSLEISLIVLLGFVFCAVSTWFTVVLGHVLDKTLINKISNDLRYFWSRGQEGDRPKDYSIYYMVALSGLGLALCLAGFIFHILGNVLMANVLTTLGIALACGGFGGVILYIAIE